MHCLTNIKFLNFIANRTLGDYVSSNDKVSIAYLTALQREKYYNPEKGKYTTYMGRALKQAIWAQSRKEKKQKKIKKKYKKLRHDKCYYLISDIEYQDEVNKFKKFLTPTSKKYFALMQEGKSQAEIADLFGVSRQAINFSLQRAYENYQNFS